ncbi:U32 family peptidase [bacterium]|nr:MAG: U32 family peptidase [bacterium]
MDGGNKNNGGNGRKTLELLSPAGNLETGLEAVNHGADAIYIGGPSFGARGAAANPVADIEALCSYAHRYFAKVYVALNTILRDEELPVAERVIREVYEAGADALIIQDAGLLELDLPPIALHASTQMDNRTPQKVRFLEDAGFSQVVLARELSLGQIREIASETSVKLECFVHGALCVSFSGQCYLSFAQTGRSANRGECAQLCRLPFTLLGPGGKIICKDRHLLSLRDLNRSGNLRELIDAGVSSFKIEGRLKEISYVKNVTAHYRRLLDEILLEKSGYSPSSSGKSRFFFEPNPAKSFNRGMTEYFLHGRSREITSFFTPKSVGESAGKVTAVARDYLETDATLEIHNGDGLCFFTPGGELVGFRVNRAEGSRLYPAESVKELAAGTELYRNRDQEFEKALEKKSAERKIGVKLFFGETPEGFSLRLTDEDGTSAEAAVKTERTPAVDPKKALATARTQLSRLGNTLFEAEEVEIEGAGRCFIPVSVLNGLRREGVAALEEARAKAYKRPERALEKDPPPRYPVASLTYLGNVCNKRARDFYARHGVTGIDEGYEWRAETGEVPLMFTKHCLRYSFGLCPKEKEGEKPEPLTLMMGQTPLTLRFDCKNCEMQVVGKLKSRP